MKAKRILLPLVLVSALFLSACGVKITNRTPETIPSTTTGIYTLTAQAEVKRKPVVPSSMVAYVVVNENKFPMLPCTENDGHFEYDYAAAPTADLARFYYILQYREQKTDKPLGDVQEIISGLYQMKITGNEGITLDAAHALVAPLINPLHVLPNTLTLEPKQRLALAFALDYPAPQGGLYLNITTNIPDSIIMPEVLIPEGARTVNATIEAGEPGQGTLFINAADLPELTVPITIKD